MRESLILVIMFIRVPLNRIKVSRLPEIQGCRMFIKWDKMLQEGYQM